MGRQIKQYSVEVNEIPDVETAKRLAKIYDRLLCQQIENIIQSNNGIGASVPSQPDVVAEGSLSPVGV